MNLNSDSFAANETVGLPGSHIDDAIALTD
jgi:hypothetical protein